MFRFFSKKKPVDKMEVQVAYLAERKKEQHEIEMKRYEEIKFQCRHSEGASHVIHKAVHQMIYVQPTFLGNYPLRSSILAGNVLGGIVGVLIGIQAQLGALTILLSLGMAIGFGLIFILSALVAIGISDTLKHLEEHHFGAQSYGVLVK